MGNLEEGADLIRDFFSLKTPCKECPLANDGRFLGLRRGKREAMAKALTEHDETFICHMTYNEEMTKQRHCAGALIVLIKGGQLWNNAMYKISEGFGFNADSYDLAAPTYASMADFVEHGGDE